MQTLIYAEISLKSWERSHVILPAQTTRNFAPLHRPLSFLSELWSGTQAITTVARKEMNEKHHEKWLGAAEQSRSGSQVKKFDK